MTSQTPDPSRWIKATRSLSQNDCVEMRRAGDAIEVRHSRHPDGPTLRYTSGEFAAWLDGAKKGEFDHLA
jgi:Domain of unknown function (DUF397)